MPDWIFCDCPHCGNTLRLDPDKAEEASTCPACKRMVTPSMVAPPPAPAPEPSPPAASGPDEQDFQRSRRRRRNVSQPAPEQSAEDEAPLTAEPETPAPPRIALKAEGDAQATADFANAPPAAPPPPIDQGKVRKVDWTEEEEASLGRGFAEEFEPDYDPFTDGSDESGEQEFDEDGNPIPKKRRKRRFGIWWGNLDWETTAPRSGVHEKSIKRLIRAGYVVLAVGFVILGVQMFKSRGRTGADHGPGAGEAKKVMLTLPGEGQAPLSKDESVQVLREALATRPKEIIASMRPTVERFLSSPKWTDRLLVARDPDRVRPLMEKYHASHPDVPYAFLHVGMDESVSYRDNLMVLNVVMKDYSQKQIAIAYENGRFLIDWESFVGYGDLEPMQMKDLRPTKPFLMRAGVSRSLPPYFNYAFTDEANLDCYVLTFPDESYAFGYVEKLTPVANRVNEFIGQNPSVLLTLRLRYPDGAVVGDQVWIEEVLAEGWVLAEDPPAPTP